MENFEHIFFDFDGTIMNTSEGVFEGFDRVREYFNIELGGSYTGALHGEEITADNGILRFTLEGNSAEIWIPVLK